MVWHTVSARYKKAVTNTPVSTARGLLCHSAPADALSLPCPPEKNAVPQARGGPKRRLEGQCLQAVSLPSAGAPRARAAAVGAPGLFPVPEPHPGTGAAADPEGLPGGTARNPAPSTLQVIHSLGCSQPGACRESASRSTSEGYSSRSPQEAAIMDRTNSGKRTLNRVILPDDG